MIKCLFLSLAFLHAASAQGQAPVEIVRVGAFHEDEVSLAKGGAWLALIVEGNQSKLVSTSVTIERVFDLIVDNPGEKTGRKVSADTSSEPLILIRSRGLRSGAVETALAEARAVPIHEHVSVAEYQLQVVCNPTVVVSNRQEYRCPLLLIEGNRRQEIAAFGAWQGSETKLEFASEHEPRILWAGDLDRDERIDLLVDTSDHYNESSITLYLSSAAGPDEILGKAARFRVVGC